MHSRRYKPGDEKNILRLFKYAYGKSLPINFWRWRFLENPFGEGIIHLMFDGEDLVGHYAVIPQPLMVSGESIKAALSMTTMTHPAYSRKGIFTTLASEVYKECKRVGIKCVYGFPNKNSYHGLVNNLGWEGLGEIRYFRLDRIPDARIKERYLSYEKIVRFDDEFAGLWGKTCSIAPVVIPRKPTYLQWRFLGYAPSTYHAYKARDIVGQLRGYIIYKLYKGELGAVGEIVDILADGPDIFNDLIRHAVKFFRDNAETIAIWSAVSDWERETLRYWGFEEKRWVGFDSVEWPTYFGVKLLDDDEELKTALDFSNWRITMGDSDVF